MDYKWFTMNDKLITHDCMLITSVIRIITILLLELLSLFRITSGLLEIIRLDKRMVQQITRLASPSLFY